MQNGNAGVVVVAHDVTRRYGQGDTAVDALRGVSLEIGRGQLTAVMGASVARIGGQLLLSPGGAPEATRVVDQLKMRGLVDKLYFVDRARLARR